jgi:DNA-binding IscR family transcriptional regulator
MKVLGNSTNQMLICMALLNRKVDYALLILSYLHHTPEGGCARALAGRFGLSRAFVANILKALCRKGFVASHRGVKGGYLLRPEAGGRTLAELMDSLGDPFSLAECNREAPDQREPPGRPWLASDARAGVNAGGELGNHARAVEPTATAARSSRSAGQRVRPAFGARAG